VKIRGNLFSNKKFCFSIEKNDDSNENRQCLTSTFLYLTSKFRYKVQKTVQLQVQVHAHTSVTYAYNFKRNHSLEMILENYSAFISIVHLKIQSPFKFLTDFWKNGQKHEKWEEIYILVFEELFLNLEKNKYGWYVDFDLDIPV